MSVSISSYDAERLRERLGPAEAQYGDQVLVAALDGNLGPLACGTTIVDGDANDLDPTLDQVGVILFWNDLAGETGYRWQIDLNSATYTTEDSSFEFAPNTIGTYWTQGVGGGSVTSTFRVFGHVGHAPGHGSTPIAGDIVSNECTVTFSAALDV